MKKPGLRRTHSAFWRRGVGSPGVGLGPEVIAEALLDELYLERGELTELPLQVGPPELVVEIVGSSQAYDLHQKKNVCRRNGIREY